MAFPTTPILDTFTRTEGPPPSADYSTPTFLSGMQADGDECVSSGVNGLAVYDTVYPSGQEVFAQLTQKPSDGNAASLLLQAQQVGSALTLDAYQIVITSVAGAGNDTIQLQRASNAATFNIGSAITQEVTAGDWFGIRRFATTLQVWYGSTLAGMTLQTTQTDNNISGTGQLALGFGSTSGAWDNFGGGTWIPYPRPRAGSQTLRTFDRVGRRIGGARLFQMGDYRNEIATLGKERKLWFIPQYAGVGALRREGRP